MRSRLYKKGFDSNQIFIYIASAIIVGFVLFFGFRAVNLFVSSAEDISQVIFIEDLKDITRTVSIEFGSVDFLNLRVPSQFDSICLTDNSVFNELACRGDTIPNAVCDIWNLSVTDAEFQDKNLFFLTKDGSLGAQEYVTNVKIEDLNVICIRKDQGETRLRLEGKKRIAVVSVVN
ncbi:MAG: hypothetical protein ACI8Y7_000164 [Candidatus Woesearchaeota archaeon]|jgi:hypothetical protein